ncbi:MAG: hypothetical protein ACW9W4_07875 [Candidatus Nitrosopumilus sp. bin_7KS]
MKTGFLTIIGVILLTIGITLHFYFSSLNTTYLETFLIQSNCKIISSQILDNLNKSLETNCHMQLHLLQSAIVKLFLGLGVLLTLGGSFLAHAGIKENED